MTRTAGRWRPAVALVAAALAMAATAGTATGSAGTVVGVARVAIGIGAPPPMADGFGLTQVAPAVGGPTDFHLTVTTPEVAGRHHLKIILPRGYYDDPARRYPVLYFLHGSPDNPLNQTYPALTTSNAMITVIPDGGARGWYANWRDQNTPAGAQNWENFHLGQVIPFVDANLRTVATRKARAVAGVSMGGFGAFHYAQDHPELFGQTASLSGDIDLSIDSMDLRLAVVASLVDGQGVICGLSSGSCDPANSPYKPAVDSDALFGSPYPVLNADWRWNEVDPSRHMDRLAGVGVSVYVGNGRGVVTQPEFWLEGAAKHVKDAMDALGMPYHYVDYGDGSTWGGQCDGGHNGGCWEQDLRVPQLLDHTSGIGDHTSDPAFAYAEEVALVATRPAPGPVTGDRRRFRSLHTGGRTRRPVRPGSGGARIMGLTEGLPEAAANGRTRRQFLAGAAALGSAMAVGQAAGAAALPRAAGTGARGGSGRSVAGLLLPFQSLTRPLDLGDLAPDTLRRILAGALDEVLHLPADELAYFVDRLLVHLTSCDLRREQQWERVPWWDFIGAGRMSHDYQRLLGVGLTRDLVATRAEQASTRTVARTVVEAFLLNGLLGRGGDGQPDRVLNGPTSEAWIDPWVAHLTSLGVDFRTGTEVLEVLYAEGRITGVRVAPAGGGTPGTVRADHYLSALPVEHARATWGPRLRAADPQLARCDAIGTDWMTGIQFYLRRPVRLVHGHAVCLDSPWSLTAVGQAQFWDRDFAAAYGDGTVRDCLSVCVSEWDRPGILYGRTAKECSREEVAREVWEQCRRAFDRPGAGWPADADVHSWFLDPAVTGLGGPAPANREQLLVHPAGTLYRRPSATTAVGNFFLAGDYVRTEVDLATMEGANESARRAVNALLDADGSTAERCRIRGLFRPPELEPLKLVDEARYRLGLPNTFDLG